MIKIQRLFILLSFLFLVQTSFAQLSGTYTVGGSSPDYTTLDNALSALMASGASGKVIFSIRPGTYNISYFGLFSVHNDSIIFESSSMDSSSVIITSTAYMPLEMSYAREVAFKELTIIDIAGPFIDLGYESLTVQNCVIETSFQMSDLTYVTFTNDSINNVSGLYVIASNTDIENNKIYGSTMVSYSNSTLIKNNLLNDPYTPLSVGYSPGAWIVDNVSSGNDFLISYSDNSMVTGNTITGSIFDVGYSSGTYVMDNKINTSSYSRLVDESGIFFVNNFIWNYFSVNFSTNCWIQDNNFSPNSILDLGSNLSTYCYVNNNNFYQPVYSLSSTNLINHNNYFPIGSPYDTSQTNFDPEYASVGDLHATNLHLSGSGIYIGNIRYDIDNVIRPNPPSMGANEICISGDTIDLSCGDSLSVAFCNLPDSGNFTWSPSTGLSNPSIAKPKASPSTGTLYHVHNAIAGFSDSVYVKVIPYQVQAYQNISIYCGDSVYLFANYNAKAAYHWSPSIGLSDTNSWRTLAKLSATVVYTVTANVPGCGTTFSTVKVAVDSLPNLSVSYKDSCLSVNFINQTMCATSYLWNFGDSTTSTSVSPSHIYDTTGDFYITFIACNSFGCDTIKGYISVYCNPTAVKQIQSKLSDFKYYPNPTTGKFTVEYNISNQVSQVQLELMDIYGNEILKEDLPVSSGQYSHDFDLSAKPAGIYFLMLNVGSTRITRKIVLVK